MMDNPAGAVDDKPRHQQPDQDDKKFPRRCLHALASLAGAGIRVKAGGQHLSGNFAQGGNAGAPLPENRNVRPARNFSSIHASAASRASTEALSPNVSLTCAKRSMLPGPKIKLPPS